MKLKILILSVWVCTAAMGQDFLMKRKLADSYFNSFDYVKALPMYEQLLKSHPGDAELYRKLAVISDRLNASVDAEKYYAFLVGQSDVTSREVLHYARALARNGKYADAGEWYRKYSDMNRDDTRGYAFSKAFTNVAAFYSDSAAYRVQKTPFSTSAGEFSPAWYGRSLVFLSDRSRSSVIRSTFNWTGSSFLDLYKVEPDRKEAFKFSKELNSAYHEGPVCFTSRLDTIFFTRSSGTKGKEGIMNLCIMQACLDKNTGKWINLQQLPFNNAEYSCAHPVLSPDGSLLYFASDMPGGAGGMDLYSSMKTVDSSGTVTWSTPVSLGPGINTPGNELFPFADSAGNLWFASDGIPGLGGLDIFCAKKSHDGFSAPLNPGYPLNTRWDDFGYISDTAGTAGYLSSDRFNDPGNDDIFSFKKREK